MTEAEVIDRINSTIKKNGKNAITGEEMNFVLKAIIQLIADSGGVVNWGDIEGTIADQLDLASALDGKVDTVSGKGLSTNDFTNTLKTKLDGIQAGAEVNVNADWDATTGDAQILNKPAIPSVEGLVPYTGATADVDLDTFGLDAKFIKIKGNGGTGHLNLKHQSSEATAGGSESVIYADASGNPKWKNDGNAVQEIALVNTILSKLGVFYLPFTPSSVVTGTTSETQVAVVEIPANSIKSVDNLKIYTPIVKTGTAGLCTVTYKLSTSPTMPSGTTDRIAFVAGSTGSLWIGMNRNPSYNSGNLIIAATTTSLISDLTTAAQAPSVVAKDNSVTLYLYVSITLGNSSDSAYLSGGYITNN